MSTSLKIAILSVASIALFGCCGNVFTGKYFCYPPSARPHEGNFEFEGYVGVEAADGPLRFVNRKKWHVSFHNKEGKCLFKEEGKVEMGLPEFETDWSVRNSPTVAILDEKGNVILKKTFDLSAVLPER